MKKTFSIILIFTLLLSCSQKDHEDSMHYNSLTMDAKMGSPERMVMSDMSIPLSGNSSELIERKIQKNARTQIEVKDINLAISKVEKIIQKFEGEIINSNRGGADIGNPYANISFRVPVEYLENTLKEILDISTKVIREEIYTNDVTEEFINVEAKLLNMKSTESRFQELLLKTGNVKEILEVEIQLTRIRGEIDGLEGRLKYLNQTTSTSKIDLNIQQEPSISGDKWGFSESLKSALMNLTSFGKFTADFLINFVVFLPIILIILVLPFIIWKFSPKIFKRKK
ncbi:MAG: hypothetical protein CL764_06975 [Chloroflexi bacterium]|nr:hypothetical protein [Chloroflexota bacterium]